MLYRLWPFSDFKEIVCPDGSKRLVLRNMDKVHKVFSLNMYEVEMKMDASLMNAESINAAGGVEVHKKVQPIIKEINAIHAKAIDDFKAAYLDYTTNPCSKDKVLTNTIRRIQDSAFTLLNNQIEKLNSGVQK